MKVEIVTLPKQKTWGIIEHPKYLGHFHTDYVGQWGRGDYALGHKIGGPEKHMQIGKNAIITGDFKITSMSRGHSAANFNGTFRGADEFAYQFGMKGMTELLDLLQSGVFTISDGYISGRWTFAKQGANIFLKPYVGA